MASARDHDIVMFGATGFTGGLTAEYLAENAPEGTRIALAGRNREKLEAVRDRIGKDLPLLHADVSDRASIDDVASKTRVVITTVGPYIEYGEPVVAACAEHGTDYVDLTGEPEFVDRMYVAHHERAVETGARIVHACGFDSVPHDLGAQFTVEQLPEGVPIEMRGYVRAGGRPSGGTFATMLTALSRARQNVQAARARRAAEVATDSRHVRAIRAGVHRAPGRGWAVPMPLLDQQIILRSARALERYGPEFSYAHYFVLPNLPVVAAGAAGFAGLAAAAQIPPLRRSLLKRMPQGTGPSEERRAESWFRVRFVGQGGGKRVVAEVSGGDPGYGETSKILSESALCLANDDLPKVGGQTTSAIAMGHALTDRLRRAGIGFDVLES